MSSPHRPDRLLPLLALITGGLAIYFLSQGVFSRNQAAGPLPVGAGSGRLVHADESSFDELVLRSEEPVLVDFYADWCVPCRSLAPVLERVAGQLTSGRIVKINVDESRGLSARYGISVVPTLVLFVGGREVERLRGAPGEAELASLFNVERYRGNSQTRSPVELR